MPLIDPATPIAQIVLEHPECARVLREHRLDFCCRGDASLADACASRGLEAASVVAELEQAVAAREPATLDLRALSTPELVEHVVTRHHAYLRRALPFVEALALKVARVHGARGPKLAALADAVVEVRAMLEPHIDDEERALFPELLARAPDGARLAREARAVRDDHLRLGEALRRVRALADDYAPPDWACTSYRTLFRELEALEADTFEHIHAENHLLLPPPLPEREAPRAEPPR